LRTDGSLAVVRHGHRSSHLEVLVSQEALNATVALGVFRVWLVGLVGKGWEVNADGIGKESIGAVAVDLCAGRLAGSDC
jgi:hypothetical protein